MYTSNKPYNSNFILVKARDAYFHSYILFTKVRYECNLLHEYICIYIKEL